MTAPAEMHVLASPHVPWAPRLHFNAEGATKVSSVAAQAFKALAPEGDVAITPDPVDPSRATLQVTGPVPEPVLAMPEGKELTFSAFSQDPLLCHTRFADLCRLWKGLQAVTPERYEEFRAIQGEEDWARRFRGRPQDLAEVSLMAYFAGHLSLDEVVVCQNLSAVLKESREMDFPCQVQTFGRADTETLRAWFRDFCYPTFNRAEACSAWYEDNFNYWSDDQARVLAQVQSERSPILRTAITYTPGETKEGEALSVERRLTDGLGFKVGYSDDSYALISRFLWDLLWNQATGVKRASSSSPMLGYAASWAILEEGPRGVSVGSALLDPLPKVHNAGWGCSASVSWHDTYHLSIEHCFSPEQVAMLQRFGKWVREYKGESYLGGKILDREAVFIQKWRRFKIAPFLAISGLCRETDFGEYKPFFIKELQDLGPEMRRAFLIEILTRQMLELEFRPYLEFLKPLTSWIQELGIAPGSSLGEILPVAVCLDPTRVDTLSQDEFIDTFRTLASRKNNAIIYDYLPPVLNRFAEKFHALFPETTETFREFKRARCLEIHAFYSIGPGLEDPIHLPNGTPLTFTGSFNEAWEGIDDYQRQLAWIWMSSVPPEEYEAFVTQQKSGAGRPHDSTAVSDTVGYVQERIGWIVVPEAYAGRSKEFAAVSLLAGVAGDLPMDQETILQYIAELSSYL